MWRGALLSRYWQTWVKGDGIICMDLELNVIFFTV